MKKTQKKHIFKVAPCTSVQKAFYIDQTCVENSSLGIALKTAFFRQTLEEKTLDIFYNCMASILKQYVSC